MKTTLMKRFKSKKGFLLLATLVVAAAAAAGGYAYWTTGGSGMGSGTTGTTANIVVNQTSASSGLYPGGSVALSGDFTNLTDPGAVYITSVTASVDTFSLQADPSKPACTQADFSTSGISNTPGDIPHGSHQGAWSGLSLNMTDAGTNQDNCKSITVPIAYSAS